jgi:membrane-bound lytic murein transglycosylase B
LTRTLLISLLLPLGLSAQEPVAGPESAPVRVDTGRADVQEFIQQMREQHGMDSEALAQMLGQAEIKQSILEAISKPAERTLSWREYRPIFLTEQRIKLGQEFWTSQAEHIERISAEYGVDPSVLVAIIGVETKYGRITGSYRVIDALGTLAFEYPPRGDFFRSELSHFLLLSRESGVDPLTATGSYAGAMGAPQFIPSSFRAYAVDGDKDQRIDIWSNWQDVLASVANYFHRHGWQSGQPVAVQASRTTDAEPGSRELGLDTTVQALRDEGWAFNTSMPPESAAMAIKLSGESGPEYWVGFQNFHVITRYNRSVLYAMAVHQLAMELDKRMAGPQ